MENKKSFTLYYVVGVIVLVVVILFFSLKNTNVMNNPAYTNTTDNTTLEPQSTLDTSGTTTGAAGATISYTDALAKYADRRIQFNKICQATPNKVTYKDNTGVMLDNRSALARTIKVGTEVYSVKGYGFRIAVLPNVLLKSKSITVDCDKSNNVATILVQE